MDPTEHNEHVFHFEEGHPNFESFCHENGFTFWFGRELMTLLGYKTWDSFQKVIS